MKKRRPQNKKHFDRWFTSKIFDLIKSLFSQICFVIIAVFALYLLKGTKEIAPVMFCICLMLFLVSTDYKNIPKLLDKIFK